MPTLCSCSSLYKDERVTYHLHLQIKPLYTFLPLISCYGEALLIMPSPGFYHG